MSTRVGTASNLTGSDNYDILTFDFPDGYPSSKLAFTMGRIPRKITGVQKVAQIFLKCLMTTKGTDLFDPTAGTSLPDYLRYSNIMINNDREVRSVIVSAVQDAVSQAKYILNRPNVSQEGQLDTVEVINISLQDEGISMIFKMITRAGVSAKIAVPFSSTGLNINE